MCRTHAKSSEILHDAPEVLPLKNRHRKPPAVTRHWDACYQDRSPCLDSTCRCSASARKKSDRIAELHSSDPTCHQDAPSPCTCCNSFSPAPLMPDPLSMHRAWSRRATSPM